MIRTQTALLRHAQDFFRSDLVGLYGWDRDVRLDPPELRPVIPPGIDRAERRKQMEAREGKGKWLEQERLRFGPWEILIYSAAERGPVGEVILRRTDGVGIMDLVAGPLDSATWSKIGEWIRSNDKLRRSDNVGGGQREPSETVRVP